MLPLLTQKKSYEKRKESVQQFLREWDEGKEVSAYDADEVLMVSE